MSNTKKISNLKDFIQSHGYMTVFFDSIDSHRATYKSSEYIITGIITGSTTLGNMESISSVLFELHRTGIVIREMPSEGNASGAIIFKN